MTRTFLLGDQQFGNSPTQLEASKSTVHQRHAKQFLTMLSLIMHVKGFKHSSTKSPAWETVEPLLKGLTPMNSLMFSVLLLVMHIARKPLSL